MSERDTEEASPDAGERAEELNAEVQELRRAALAEVRKFGDPVLKSPASRVSEFGPELGREAERMIGIMHGALGVGLAATQLGVMRRMLVFGAGPDAEPRALVNPQIEWSSEDLITAEEGCLSLPGIAVDVERPLYTRVSGLDVDGQPVLLEASGLEARVLHHEIDHLDGVLMIDRTVREQRRAALRALRDKQAFSPAMLEDEDSEEPAADAVGVAEPERG